MPISGDGRTIIGELSEDSIGVGNEKCLAKTDACAARAIEALAVETACDGLDRWRIKNGYPMDDDWVFASPASKGELPYWSFSLFPVYIRPALKAVEIAGKVGWHTFRHSFATILKSHGEDVKTVQELLRHANSSVTMNLYAQAVTDIKRSAQSKVARLVFEPRKGILK